CARLGVVARYFDVW
nr:immunoglobulin heavy chain junction region [Mus musculus]MBK4189110.1 immunoglobulin heavy chain junction region [Mus musculus]